MSTPSDQRQTFSPLMSPDRDYEEINTYVVCWGLFFAVLFALAVGYLALKIGQTVDAFAPVSVLAMAYDFVLNTLGWWQELLTTTAVSWGEALADKYELVFSIDNDAALLGIGYFTGLRYGLIIAAGSFFSFLVCIPVAYFIGGDHAMVVGGKDILLAQAPVGAVFSQYVRHIGIGMLAMAGIIGLLTMSGVVGRVMRRAFCPALCPSALCSC